MGEVSFKLTVVVPVYNGEKCLGDTIERLHRATCGKTEILLIDDGSDDGSPELIESLRARFPELRCVRKGNGGIAEARNLGLRLARGRYICFCDQDDEVEPWMYTDLIGRMEREDAQIGLCSTGRIIRGKKSAYERLEDGCCRGNEIWRELLFPILFRGYRYPFVGKKNYLYGTIWKAVFDRGFLRSAGMGFRRFAADEDDWLFLTEALTLARTVVISSRIGYYWRVHEESRSHQLRFSPDLTERFPALDAYVEGFLRRKKLPPRILRLYRQVSLCGHYVEAYQNEVGAPAGDERRKYREKLRAYLEESDYREQLTCVKYLRGSAFQRQILCRSIRLLGIEKTFYVNRAYSRVWGFLEKQRCAVLLERFLKLRG